jgi:lipoprotein-anchoring transpeptidase ErfK/SrfK
MTRYIRTLGLSLLLGSALAWGLAGIAGAHGLAPRVSQAYGKEIVVSLSRQEVYAYDHGELIFANYVETGRPELSTPRGYFSVLMKGRNLTFTSPWPRGSPFWYYPTHINYALMFKYGGFYLHDAWWHCTFGPGSNVDHWTRGCPGWTGGHWETGSHGCIGMTISDARRVYEWASVGTPVIVE